VGILHVLICDLMAHQDKKKDIKFKIKTVVANKSSWHTQRMTNMRELRSQVSAVNDQDENDNMQYITQSLTKQKRDNVIFMKNRLTQQTTQRTKE